jgi:hypothetical protein
MSNEVLLGIPGLARMMATRAHLKSLVLGVVRRYGTDSCFENLEAWALLFPPSL